MGTKGAGGRFPSVPVIYYSCLLLSTGIKYKSALSEVLSSDGADLLSVTVILISQYYFLFFSIAARSNLAASSDDPGF